MARQVHIPFALDAVSFLKQDIGGLSREFNGFAFGQSISEPHRVSGKTLPLTEFFALMQEEWMNGLPRGFAEYQTLFQCNTPGSIPALWALYHGVAGLASDPPVMPAAADVRRYAKVFYAVAIGFVLVAIASGLFSRLFHLVPGR